MNQDPESQKYSTYRYPILEFIDQHVKETGHSPTGREIAEKIGTVNSVVSYHLTQMEQESWLTWEKIKKTKKDEPEHEQQKRQHEQQRAGTIRLTEKGQEALKHYQEHQSQLGFPKNKQVLEPVYAILSARISNQKAVRLVNIPIINLVSASFGVEVHSSDFSLSGLGPDSYISINEDMIPSRLKIEELFGLEVRGDSMIEADIQSGDYVICKRTPTAKNGDLCIVWIDETEVTLKYFYKHENKIRLQPANSQMSPMIIGPGYSEHEIRIEGKVVLVVRL